MVVDWQERLFPAMAADRRDAALRAAENLVWLARELGMPILVSEQYPQGLGPTVASLRVSEAVPKTHFSAVQEPAFAARLDAVAADEWVVVGMETHICVAQTVADLRARGVATRVVVDAVLSRRELDWHVGVERMRDLGASIDTAEGVLFGWLGQAGGPLFKELQRRIR
jgi:nicotinamidase-related amidase